MIVFYFILTYGFLITFLILFGYYRQREKENGYLAGTNDKGIRLEELVVIIPFRNEELKLNRLIQSIKKSKHLPKEFIFVNDHSEDQSAQLLERELKDFPIRILSLPIDQTGKKRAIRLGISESDSEFILSHDADVGFASNYFSMIERLIKTDMYILPVIFKSEKWFEYFFEIDSDLANAANCGISGLNRPVLASGANLLYLRKSFEKYDKIESHEHIASGDDIYLLRDFRNADADIRLITSRSIAVTTETPQTFSEFIHQRLRWITKTGDVNDNLSSGLVIFQGFFTLVFIGLLIYAAIMQEWKHFVILYLLKTGIDMVMFLPYFNRIKRLKTWLIIPVYEILFPFYILLLASLVPWFKPVWKGRS